MQPWIDAVIPELTMNEDHTKPDEDAVDLYSKTQGATERRKPSSLDPSAAERDRVCKMASISIGRWDYVNSKL